MTDITLMLKSIKLILAGVILLAVVAVIAVAAIGQKAQHDEIMKNGVNVAATPVQVDTRQDSRTTGTGTHKRTIRETKYSAVFKYAVEGKEYKVNSKEFTTRGPAESLLNKETTVRYLPKDPNKALILE